MERSEAEIREAATMLVVNLGWFCALGMYEASEEMECPGFWVGTYIEPELLEQISAYFIERYHYDERVIIN